MVKNKNRAVFLDRDGIINEAIVKDGRPTSPLKVSEVLICKGVNIGVSNLRKLGFELVVISNQPEVSRGRLTLSELLKINMKISKQTGLKHIYCCTHSDADECDCRKPAPGLIYKACSTLGLDPRSSYFVGDRWKDIEAGEKAGCKTIWIDKGYNEKSPENYTYRVTSFLEVVKIIDLELNMNGEGSLETTRRHL